MYSIYADGKPLYLPGNEHPLFAKHAVVNPQLTLELNTAGTLTFSVPPTNECYRNLSVLKKIITVKRDDKEIWRGRVISVERNFWNEKVVKCEGDLVFLNEYYKRGFQFTGDITAYIEYLLAEYNASAENDKKFVRGVVTGGDTSSHYFNRELPYTVLELLKDHLVNEYGGFIRTRELNGVHYLDYLSQGNVSSQEITFGENLLDFNEYIDASKICTVVVPLGATSQTTNKRIDIKSVNDGKDYLENTEGIALFGRIETTQQYDNITDPAELKSAGEAFLESSDILSAELSISAVDLSYVDIDTSAFELGQRVKCVSAPHNLNELFTLSKIVIPMDTPGGETFTFGATKSGITAEMNINAKLYNQTANEAEKALVGAEKADNNAFMLASIINEGLGLYQTRLDSGFYFHDKATLETSTTIWTINSNGFAVCTTGWNEGEPQWEYGSTAAGDAIFKTISANRINANDIYTGTIKSPSGNLEIDLASDTVLIKGADGANKSTIDISPTKYTQETRLPDDTLTFVIEMFRNALKVRNDLSGAFSSVSVGGVEVKNSASDLVIAPDGITINNVAVDYVMSKTSGSSSPWVYTVEKHPGNRYVETWTYSGTFTLGFAEEYLKSGTVTGFQFNKTYTSTPNVTVTYTPDQAQAGAVCAVQSMTQTELSSILMIGYRSPTTGMLTVKVEGTVAS